MYNILLLGGTTEASALAQALADRGLRATYSYAGRVLTPRAQPLPVRIGGFGGVDGLIRYLQETGITHLIDATHPFAGQMSRHAVQAAAHCQVPLLALTRPPWQAVSGDRWHCVADIPAAVSALAGPPQRIMLALGRMHLPDFAAQPQHHYLLRLVDEPTAPPPLPWHSVVVDRGPFRVEGDIALLQAHRIERVVCKNAGGSGAAAKLAAARTLGLPVLMIDRPDLPPRTTVHDVEAALHWLAQGAHVPPPPADGTERGVYNQLPRA